MGQSDNAATQPTACQPPEKGLDRTTTSGSEERDFLSNDRRGYGSPKGTSATGRRAEGEEVSDRGVGHVVVPHGLPDDHSQAEYDTSSRSAVRLLRPRRSFARPVIIFIVFAVVAWLVAIGISRLDPDSLPKLSPQDETEPPPKRPDRFAEQPVEPPEPFKSLVLDAARSYLDSGPSAKPAPTKR